MRTNNWIEVERFFYCAIKLKQLFVHNFIRLNAFRSLLSIKNVHLFQFGLVWFKSFALLKMCGAILCIEIQAFLYVQPNERLSNPNLILKWKVCKFIFLSSFDSMQKLGSQNRNNVCFVSIVCVCI